MEHDQISNVFEKFFDAIELQPHQEDFCEATQDLVFFGGGAKI